MTTKVLFYLAGEVPTDAENALIARLKPKYDIVGVRNGLISGVYGTRLEPANAVAGTLPAAVTTAIADYADGNVTPAVTSKPEAIMILPATASFAHTGTLQLRLSKAELNETTGVVTLTDITSGAESAWASGTPGVASIDADSGLLTGVTAGTTLVTATVTYDTDKTITTTRSVTST